MAIISQRVLSVAKLLNEQLIIPRYQRPYKWEAKHVNQLLDDIIHHQAVDCYRLGTVVLHQDISVKTDDVNEDGVSKNQSAIVDGQQRLLTLTLICTLLAEKLNDQLTEHAINLQLNNHFTVKLLTHKFESKVSITNLKHNAKVIEKRLNQFTEKDMKKAKILLDFVLNRCELIVVTLDNLSEAFQFFDSQNARGKALAPYDLLKAYHLREMMQGTDEKERIAYVEAWEQGVNPDDATLSLHSIMSDFLFRIRQWIDGENGILFSRHNIDVFKGVNLDSSKYSYVEPMLALDYAVNDYNADPIRQWDQKRKSYPFQVDQVMINGKLFFDYIQHYIALHSQLFSTDKGFLRAMLTTHTDYPGSSRKGDKYVKNLFMCAVMFYYDKFGDIDLEKAAQQCFVWSYRKRLELQRIGFNSIDNHARDSDSLFKVINKANHPNQVINYQMPMVKSVKYENVPEVKTIFAELGYLVGSK